MEVESGDDYAVDEVERNDESGIFVVAAEGGGISRVLFYPTVIADYQARLARGIKAEQIAGKMKKLCGDMDSQAAWSGTEGVLKIMPR